MAGGVSLDRNIGEQLAVVTAVTPQSFSGSGTVNGASVDRYGHNTPLSCVVHLSTGAVSGTPSSFTLTAQLQHSPDGTTWSNFGSSFALNAANSDASQNVDLSGAHEYLRVAVTPAFTGGTSPSVLGQADLILGGQLELPAI